MARYNRENVSGSGPRLRVRKLCGSCLLVSLVWPVGCFKNSGTRPPVTSAIQATASPHLSSDPRMALIDKRLLFLSGHGDSAGNRVNCGWIDIRENPNPASDCALSAFAHKVPFYVRYNLQGIDSRVSIGVAGEASGKLYIVEYDSRGWGMTASDGAELTDRKHNYTIPCPSPTTLRKTQTGRLTCNGFDLNAGRNIMSPSLEPY